MSSSAILRLTKVWTTEYEAFRRRDLADRDYICLWADGIHFRIRLEEERLCALVLLWYGTTQRFDALTLTFHENADGVFVAHHYRCTRGHGVAISRGRAFSDRVR